MENKEIKYSQILFDNCSIITKNPTAKLYITDNFCIYEYKYPNWFYRLMHKLFLGFKWERL